MFQFKITKLTDEFPKKSIVNMKTGSFPQKSIFILYFVYFRNQKIENTNHSVCFRLNVKMRPLKYSSNFTFETKKVVFSQIHTNTIFL